MGLDNENKEQPENTNQGREVAAEKKEKQTKENQNDDEKDKDSCFKCLRGFVIALTVLLFILSLAILGIGAVILYDENILLGGFKKTLEETIPKEAAGSVPKEDAKLSAVSSLLKTIAVVLIALGAILVVLCVFFFAIACCCWRRRKCLICFLCFILILAIGQIVLVVILVEGSLLKGAIDSHLSVVMVTDHEKNQLLVYGLEMKFNCCGVFGAKDFFCKGIYDFRCNKGCAVKLLPDNDVCRVIDRAPLDAKELPVCKSAAEFESVASSDFRFAKLGADEKFDEKTVKNPGCGDALWEQMHMLIIGLIALASFILLLEILAGFFACYCIAKNNGLVQEKMKTDAKNKVRDISVQTSFMEDKASQTRRGSAVADSGFASLGSRRVSTPLVQSIQTPSPSQSAFSRTATSGTPASTATSAITPPPPPGFINAYNREGPGPDMNAWKGTVGGSAKKSPGELNLDSSVEIITDDGIWYQDKDGTWKMHKTAKPKPKKR